MTRSSGLLVLARRELVFDSTGWQPISAIRAAVGVSLPLVVGLSAGDVTAGTLAAAGALPAGVAAFSGIKGRWRLVLMTTAGMTLSTFVGSLVAGHVVARIVAIAIWGFLAGISVRLGSSATLVGTQAVIGLAVFGRFPSSFTVATGHAGLVAAGGCLQALLVLARPPVRFLTERRATAHTLAALSHQAHEVATAGSGVASGEAIAAAADLLSRRLDTADIAPLRGIIDTCDRVRLELVALSSVAKTDQVVDFARLVATRLRQLAQATSSGIDIPAADPSLETSVERLRASAKVATGRGSSKARYAAARASALQGQLRALEREVDALNDGRRVVVPMFATEPRSVLARTARRIADSWRMFISAVLDVHSTAWRHAARLAVTLVLTEIVGEVVPWQRGYWVTLTAVVVLKPDYAATVRRGFARVAGTVVGAMAAGLIADGLHPPPGVEVALIAVLAWLGYATFAASYAIYSLLVGALVVLLLSPVTNGSLSTAVDRGLSTLVGGAMAIAAAVIWPSWEGQTLPASMSRLVTALRDYADSVLRGFTEPDRLDLGALRSDAEAARRARVAAQASLDRAKSEPARVMGDVDTATGLMQAAGRIVRAIHALRATLEDTGEHIALPELEPFRVALVDGLERLAAAVPGSSPVTATSQTPPTAKSWPELRRLQQQIAELAPGTTAVSLHDRRLTLLADQLDPLVDAVDTAGHLQEFDAAS